MKVIYTYTNKAGRIKVLSAEEIKEMFPVKEKEIKKFIANEKKELTGTCVSVKKSFGSVTVTVSN